jgi:coenzyme F420-reducing hydrogenase gamma subunit
MEILLTVLITLGVCAVMYAFAGVVRLNRKAEELDTLRLEVIDTEDRIVKQIEDLSRDLWQRNDEITKDYINRIEGWVASTDRRFDKTYNEIHKLNETVAVSKKSY